ncbi:hypothetical protein K1T71_007953 [Dendrolimus kikuchii]|uniref:Uncharacterized protein n=1 Tax=Dendrolimus kikuchii TaxID=765133 RepID=A0ACC1CYH3_9NEOP|nr:hypothetical protein K1T71_007953 [Dendrolimus kikuchii]
MDFNRQMIPNAVLHWNYRGFTEFPLEKIRGDESDITDIYLKENLLTRLPTDIGLFSNLESLYISGNDITELPREISKLRCLKCLDVSGNRLRRIPDEIGDVKGLKFLLLDENELRELPLRLAELRCLRYLSVCDNNMTWLPQKPVYNYHHCEFRFWRNTNLNCLPYSLWYHMFRDQQTRSLNIGCLNILNNHPTHDTRSCSLKLNQDSKEWEYCVEVPHNNIIIETYNSPPTLFELSRRIFYDMLFKAAKELTTGSFSIYSDNNHEEIHENENFCELQINFREFNISNELTNDLDVNGNRCDKSENDFRQNIRRNLYNVPADVIREYYDFIPSFIKRDLGNGPISRCENTNCKNPVFDFAYYDFCLGKLTLIDSTEEVVLSAVFCSKRCLNTWKSNKATVSWMIK